jgi:hypothetical protein
MPFSFNVTCNGDEHELVIDGKAVLHVKGHDPESLSMMQAFQAFGASVDKPCLRIAELWEYVQHEFEKPHKKAQWDGPEIFDEEDFDFDTFVEYLVDILERRIEDESTGGGARPPYSAPRIAELIEIIAPNTLDVESTYSEFDQEYGRVDHHYTFYLTASNGGPRWYGHRGREIAEWERAIQNEIYDFVTYQSAAMDLCESSGDYCTPEVIVEVLKAMGLEDQELDEPDAPYHPDPDEWDPDDPPEYALLFESDEFDEPRMTFWHSSRDLKEAMEFSKYLLSNWGVDVKIMMLTLKTEDELAEEERAKQEALEEALYLQKQQHLFGEPPPPIPKEPELSEHEQILAHYVEW